MGKRVTLILSIASSPMINRSLCMFLIMSGAGTLHHPQDYYSLDYPAVSWLVPLLPVIPSPLQSLGHTAEWSSWNSNLITSFFWWNPSVASHCHWIMARLLNLVSEVPAPILPPQAFSLHPLLCCIDTPQLLHTPHSSFLTIVWVTSAHPLGLGLGICLSGSGNCTPPPHPPHLPQVLLDVLKLSILSVPLRSSLRGNDYLIISL